MSCKRGKAAMLIMADPFAKQARRASAVHHLRKHGCQGYAQRRRARAAAAADPAAGGGPAEEE